jgi:hypothetical protein
MKYSEIKMLKLNKNRTYIVISSSFAAILFLYLPVLTYSSMKKLYLLVSFSLAIFSVSAQDYSCHDAELVMSGPCNSNLVATATIVNSGSQAFDVICRISSATMFPGHQKFFCFGAFCWDVSTTTSPLPTTINPGESAALSADCIPNNIEGTSYVTYQFYDQSGSSDTFSLSFTYTFTPVGVPEVNASKYTLAQASPNPATNFTAINYNYAQGKDASLVFHNLLGSVVKEIKLNARQNTLVIPVSDFPSGIYIYSLVIDGKPAASKKLVVSHR